jgi:hypothetical protein
VSPVRHELGLYIPEEGILHSDYAKISNLTYAFIDVFSDYCCLMFVYVGGMWVRILECG